MSEKKARTRRVRTPARIILSDNGKVTITIEEPAAGPLRPSWPRDFILTKTTRRPRP